MKLSDSMKPWAPSGRPDYLCLLKGRNQHPRDREAFLSNQAELLAELVRQADQGEVEQANRLLQDRLPAEQLDYLPPDLLNNPKTALQLLHHPAVEGGKLHRWKAGADQLLMSNPMSKAQAQKEAAELNLGTYLSRLL